MPIIYVNTQKHVAKLFNLRITGVESVIEIEFYTYRDKKLIKRLKLVLLAQVPRKSAGL